MSQMMPFPQPAMLAHVPDRNRWVLQQPLTWNDSQGFSIIVPAGTSTDLASTPRLAWFLVPPMDRHIVEPAIVHDYLYQRHGKLPDRSLTRTQCDQVLADAIRAVGGKPWYVGIVHTSVRVFGGSAWAKEPTS